MATDEIYLIDKFNLWNKAGSAGDYASRLKKINREFISQIVTGVKSKPLELLEKYMISSPKSGPNLLFIESLLEVISARINGKLDELKANNASNYASFSSERSAFRKYAEFILQEVRAGKFRNGRSGKLTVNEYGIIATIKREKKISLKPDDLISTFTGRLSTQDRITGNKPFLPLALLGKLFPKRDLRQWAQKEASAVLIHLKDKTVAVSDVLSLEIDTENCHVTVILNDQTRHSVYNPPISGIKSIMGIRLIADTDVDHDPEIHTVLQELKESLPILNSITKQILDAKHACGVSSINSKNCDGIYEKVLQNKSFVDSIQSKGQDLLKELELISRNHILQLASSGWNRSEKKQAKKTKEPAAANISKALKR